VRSVIALFIGRDATNYMFGRLAATMVIFMVSLPFRILGMLFRTLMAARRARV
jgi:hypothetical protein